MYIHTDPNTLINQPKEATMQEPVKQPPEWTQVLSMFDALFSVALKYAEPQIKRMVDEQTAPLVERIKYLENHAAAADNTFTLASRIAVLEEVVKHVADEDRIKEIADEVARDVLSEHVGDYDHDEYDRLFDNIGDRIEEAINEAVDDLDISDKINDALNGATVSISV